MADDPVRHPVPEPNQTRQHGVTQIPEDGADDPSGHAPEAETMDIGNEEAKVGLEGGADSYEPEPLRIDEKIAEAEQDALEE